MLSYIHIAARFSYCFSSVTTRMIANNYGLSFVHRSIEEKMKSEIEEEDDNRRKEIEFFFLTCNIYYNDIELKFYK